MGRKTKPDEELLRKDSTGRSRMARWLRAVRAFDDLTQQGLAEIAGISRSYINQMEQDDRKIPPEVISKIWEKYPEVPPPLANNSGLLLVNETRPKLAYTGLVPSSVEPPKRPEMKTIDARFAGEGRFFRTVAGGSAEPYLLENDLVVWEQDAEPPLGSITLIQSPKGDRSAIRVWVFDEATAAPIAKPLNPDYAPAEDDSSWLPVARLVGAISGSDGPERTWYHPPGIRPDHLKNR